MSEIPQYVVDLATQVASDLDLAFLDAASIHAESLKEAEDDAILRIANAIGRGIELYRQSQADAAHPMTATPSETHEAALSDERLRELSIYAEIIAIVDDCSERMKRTGESHRMFAKWVSEGVNALLARRTQPSAGEPVTGQHKWIKSTLGHGETMCEYCLITNREAAVLGELNTCHKAPTQPDQSRVERLEAALKDVINEVLNVSSASYIREPVLTKAIQALHGDRP